MRRRSVSFRIAEAVINARGLRLRTARDAAELSAGGPIRDASWELLREEWEWHFKLPTEELRNGGRLPVARRIGNPPSFGRKADRHN
jgi:hypothetical protein